MDIKGFKIKNQKIQKIWIIIFLALLVAIFLIGISFFIVFNNSSKITSNNDIFNLDSYYAKYSVVTYSNKNQNSYIIEEYCSKEKNNTKFRFNTMNKESNYSYIITNDTFSIKSNEQKNSFQNYESVQKNVNLLSISTYIDLYNNLKNGDNISSNKNNGINVSIEEKDKLISYKIKLEDKVNCLDENLNKYLNNLRDNVKVSSLELIIDKDKNIPIEYTVYREDDRAYIDITYSEFEINKKIDEKVFSF